jgi:cation-transporting ATPase I
LGQTLVIGRRSPLVVCASLASFAALAFTVQTPGLSHFFGSRPLGPTGWMFSMGPAAAATLAAAVAAQLLYPGALNAASNQRAGEDQEPIRPERVAAARRLDTTVVTAC